MRACDSQRVLIFEEIREVSSKSQSTLRSQLINTVKYLDNNACGVLIRTQWRFSSGVSCLQYRAEEKLPLVCRG